ncbi:MAG: hypothetical protein HOP30_03685 [Cyclobacteriaceae bacterium]|nr:hypothetical protein [Cyclobacteriaceae bacterium]
MDRFIKILAIINGIIIPIFFVFMIYSYYASRSNDYYPSEPESIIVGDELEKAKRDSLVLQGITFDGPIRIYNSTNMYLPISALTYQEAKDAKIAMGSAGDFDASNFNYVNVLFLNKDYEPIGKLLNRKASISEISDSGYSAQFGFRNDESIDTTIKNIAYRIGFQDTNNDGKLNAGDDHDLYISDLTGKNLTQVTKNKHVNLYYFINSNKEMFIQYKDRNGLQDEYNPLKFGLYNISTGIFKELKNVEKELIEIEKQLAK